MIQMTVRSLLIFAMHASGPNVPEWVQWRVQWQTDAAEYSGMTIFHIALCAALAALCHPVACQSNA